MQNVVKTNTCPCLILGLIFALAPVPLSHAGTEAFLKLDGIEGESKDSKHKDTIEVLEVSWGVTQVLSQVGRGQAAGKAAFSDLTIKKRVDKSTPSLYLHCASGKHIPNATIVLRKAGETPLEYLTIKIKDVIVTSAQTAGEARSDLPTEVITLNFATIELEYTPQTAPGGAPLPVKAGWDLKANKKL